MCFYGSARSGGVIYSRSTALLLPQDLLESHNDTTSVLLERRKTSNRHMAKVQHFKIVDKYLIKLQTSYHGRNRDVMLCPGSPSMYRHRWIKLCKLLLVCDCLRLTPGGMRGGGVVESYRERCECVRHPVQDAHKTSTNTWGLHTRSGSSVGVDGAVRRISFSYSSICEHFWGADSFLWGFGKTLSALWSSTALQFTSPVWLS